MKVSFIGDVCLGRYVREKYDEFKDDYLFVSKDVIEKLRGSTVIANLESPVSDTFENRDTRFCGDPAMLAQFKWIDCFSLANNHINDFGEKAIADTKEAYYDSLQRADLKSAFSTECLPISVMSRASKRAFRLSRLTCPISYSF